MSLVPYRSRRRKQHSVIFSSEVDSGAENFRSDHMVQTVEDLEMADRFIPVITCEFELKSVGNPAHMIGYFGLLLEGLENYGRLARSLGESSTIALQAALKPLEN